MGAVVKGSSSWELADMRMQRATKVAAASALALWAGAGSSGALASPITYVDYGADIGISIGDTVYTCAAVTDPTCAFATITATGDTSTVEAFNVVGASGFINYSLDSAVLDVFFNDGRPGYTAALDPSQLFVSVDQTNGGAGFGSGYGPTYPLATFGSHVGFDTYDLASNFDAAGFGPFCPDVTLCQNGAPLYTTDGTAIVMSFHFLAYSAFSSTVSPVTETEVPEPTTLALMGLGLAAAGFVRRRRRN
jgi:hypothetical protein